MWHSGTRQSWDQRLLRWLAGLWRPAPYAYLDESSASSYQQHQHPPPSAYHVTEESPLDHQLLHAQTTDSDPDFPTTSSAHSAAVTTAAHSSEQADARQEPHGSSSHEQQSRNHDSAQAGMGGHSSSRWQWLRSGWGTQQRRRSAISRNRTDLRQHSTGQRELLQNVKAVVPHLTDEVILSELERTMDANQAVENLLSSM